jgi:hypothetical protein
MPDRLWSGLATAWAADNMANTFTGGIHGLRAPEDKAYPYIVLTDLGDGFLFGTSGGEAGQVEFRRQGFQASIFMKDDGTNDPLAQMATLIRTFDSFIQTHNRTIFKSATEGRVLDIRNTDTRIEETDDEQIYQGQIDYYARRLKIVTA